MVDIGKMNFVGIKNWPEKSELLRTKPIDVCEIETESLTSDCERHLDFLENLLRHGDKFNPKNTLYNAYYCYIQGQSSASMKNQRFIDLFDSFRRNGFQKEKCVISVTNDGARLDGSHRGSIARVLGIPALQTRVYQWPDVNKVSQIKEEIRLKKDLHGAYTGLSAYTKEDGSYLGEVVYTDIFSKQKRFFLKRSVEFNIVLALRKGNQYLYIEKTQLTLEKE